MKLTRLSAVGLKAGDFSHDLGPVNVITGPNFRGKTARLEAARLVLMGYLPELGKQPSSTFQLARGGAMTVTAALDNGSEISRSWRSERNSIKTVGPDPIVPPVLLDPQVYFALGDKDRMRYVFSRAKVELADNADQTIRANLKQIRLDDHSDKHEAAIDGLVELVCQSWGKRDGTVQDWIEVLIGEVRDRSKLAKANADRMSKTVQGLVAIQAQDDEAASGNVERQLDQHRASLTDLTSRKAILGQQIRQAEQARQDREQIQAKLLGCRDYTEEIRTNEDELARFQAQIGQYQSCTEQISTQYNDMKRRWDLNQQEIQHLEAAFRERHEKYNADLAKPCCPYCRSSRKGWQAELTKDFEAFQADTTEKLIKLRSEASEIKPRGQELRAKLDAARKTDQDQAELVRLANSRMSSIKNLQQASQERERLQARLSGLPVPADTSADQSEIARLDQQIQDLTGKIQALQVRQQAYIQARQDEKRNAQAQQRYQEILAEVQVTREAVKMLETLQAKLVEQAFRSILDLANSLTGGILHHRLEFRDGEIGWYAGPTWVSHRTFSGVEKRLAYVAISAALAADSPVRLILIDELGIFDPANQTSLIETMVKLVESGVIDQAILAGPTVQNVPAGVTVIEV